MKIYLYDQRKTFGTGLCQYLGKITKWRLSTIDIHITLDVAQLDNGEPNHSPHQLINYVRPYLPHYDTPGSYWWSKAHHKVTVKTGAQANRFIKHHLTKIDDAIQQALIDREARKHHLLDVFPDL